MAQNKREGMMFIFSAPSGAGKSTIIKQILDDVEDIKLSVSVTTRERREGEVDGVDYYFVSKERFDELVKENALYEYVYSEYKACYGTPKEPVDSLLAQGVDVVLDLDYPGVQQMQALVPDKIKTIFIMPPSIEELRQRLINRNTDSMETIEKRMRFAQKRIDESPNYDFIVLNDDLEKAVNNVKSIILNERKKHFQSKNKVGVFCSMVRKDKQNG